MNKVKIRVVDKDNRLINYLINNKIYYNSLTINKDNYYLIVDFDNYKRINRLFNTIIISYYGKYKIKNFIYVNRYILISFIIGLLLLYNLSITIFEININTNDKNLYNKVMSELNKNGISIHKKKKSFEEIEKIKNKILKDNDDILEWISIKEYGCTYIIDLTPRIKNKEINNNSKSNIIASKDGIIKHIVVYSGTKLKDENDYVKKGDIIVSGNIIKDDNIIDSVYSSASVYAEVWYLVKIIIPLEYNETYKSKVINRYYLDINGKEYTIIGKYNNDYSNKRVLILDKIYLPFKLYKEEITIYKSNRSIYDFNSAYKEGIRISENKVKNRLKDGEYIISKNTLKKEVKYSKMYLEVFFKVYENIGITSNIDFMGEKNAISN